MMLPCRRSEATKGAACSFWVLAPGLGSAMIVDGILEPLELAHLPYKKGKTYEDYVGIRGLDRLGKKKAAAPRGRCVERLRDALGAEYVVLGGGNAKKIKKLPPDTRLGDNRNAFWVAFAYGIRRRRLCVPSSWGCGDSRRCGERIL